MAKISSVDPNDDYQAESDAKTLQSAQEIQADDGRHKAALAKLQGTQDNTDAAVKHAKKHFIRQTKERMKKTFGGGDSSSGKTPFQQAAGGNDNG